MKKKKTKIGNAIFLLAVFLFTVYYIFHGEDLHAVLKTIIQVNPWYLTFGIVGVIFFIWGESIIIHYLLRTLNIKKKKWLCFQYSCIGFFFCCITPSASGGQPAQIYYMQKSKIPVPISTLILMIITIVYKSVLVFIGLFLVVFQKNFVYRYLEGVLPVFYLGLVLNVICCIIMSSLIFYPAVTRKIIIKCFSLLEYTHILKKNTQRLQKLEHAMEQYNAAAIYLKNHKKVIWNVCFITFIQRFALFFVTWFVYKAFGLYGTSVYEVVMLQAVISISVDMLPLPGGMGISEKLFLTIFKTIFTGSLLLPGMILSRGIAYYVQLLFSAVMTIIAHITIRCQTAE